MESLSILVRIVQEGPYEEVMFEHRLEPIKGIRHLTIWGKKMPYRVSQCKSHCVLKIIKISFF